MRRGFTLVELSIVLVIIALIVGGVMIGRELIRGAQIRATINQYEKFNVATTTFKLKYGGLPGDIERSKAVAFGFPYTAASYSTANGNGLIIENDETSSYPLVSPLSGEPLYYWRQLSQSGLIPGSYSAFMPTGAQGSAQIPGTPNPPPMELYFPPTSLKDRSYWIVGSNRMQNFLSIIYSNRAGPYGYWAGNDGWCAGCRAAISPIDASNIDAKIDDGKPNTGKVQARGFCAYIEFHQWGAASACSMASDLNTPNAPIWAATPVNGTCVTGGASALDATNIYATSKSFARNPACNLRLILN